MQSQMYAYFHFINAREAIEYYQEVFGATNVFRVSPDEQQAKVLHLPENANLDNITMNGGFDVLGSHFVCADSFSGALRIGNQVSVMLDLDANDEESVKAAAEFYDRVKASGRVQITMPYADQFWGGKLGIFTDEYGIEWMLHVAPWNK